MSVFWKSVILDLVLASVIALLCSGGYLPWWATVFSVTPTIILVVIALIVTYPGRDGDR